MKVQELLKDKNNWIKRELALDYNDCSVSSTSVRACKWCLLGAIYYCYHGDKIREAIIKISKVIGPSNITEWNDAKERIHEEVLLACQLADI